MNTADALIFYLFVGKDIFEKLLSLVSDEFFFASEKEQTPAWNRMKMAAYYGERNPEVFAKMGVIENANR